MEPANSYQQYQLQHLSPFLPQGEYQAWGDPYSFFWNYSIEGLLPKEFPSHAVETHGRLTSATSEAISTRYRAHSSFLALEDAFSGSPSLQWPVSTFFMQPHLPCGWHSQDLISKHCGSPQHSGARGRQIWNWGWFQLKLMFSFLSFSSEREDFHPIAGC